MIELAMRLGKKGKFFSLDTWDRAIERTDLKIKILNISRQTYTFISPTMAM
ncbi:MAG: hypothetical protein IH594_11185 [Bacteroidales bacterium]|nr:hypothetical protein [Bacteroidales bacterium]